MDRARLERLQEEAEIVEAEECFRAAFWTDVRPIVGEWRQAHGLPLEPLNALAESGYMERNEQERGSRNLKLVASYA